MVQELFREGDQYAADELNTIGGGFGAGEDLLIDSCLETAETTVAEVEVPADTIIEDASNIRNEADEDEDASFGSLSSGGLY